MKLIKIEITKDKLLAIPINERKYFVQLTTCTNEVYVLQKYAIFSASIDEQNEITRRAHNMQALFMIRLLAGKLWEGWLLLNRFFKPIRDDYYEGFSEEAKKNCEYIENYFKNNHNLCRKIRNKFSFHYSKESANMIEEILKPRPNDEKFFMYFSQNHGNCFYELSDTLINHALLSMVKTKKEKTQMENLLKEISVLTEHFLHFIGECVLVFSRKYLDAKFEEIEITEEADINSVHIPYFVTEK